MTGKVSQAYRRTLFTLVLKSFSLVFAEIACDLQMGLRIWNAVYMALLILDTMSRLVPPSQETMLPR